MGVLDRLILRDDQWERMAAHVIGDERTRGSSGRDNRMFVEGVLWIARTGSPWRDRPDAVLADAAYDSDAFRDAIAKAGAVAVIPDNPSRAMKHDLDKALYRERHLVECCFSRLKQFRRVATRYEKTARNYLAIVTL